MTNDNEEIPEDVFKAFAPHQLRDQLFENAKNVAEIIDQEEESLVRDFSRVIYIVEFYHWNDILIEHRMRRVLGWQLIREERKTAALFELIESSELRHPQVRKLLHASEIIDDGLNGELERHRRIRNKIVHNQKERATLDIDELDNDNLMSEIERANNLYMKMANAEFLEDFSEN